MPPMHEVVEWAREEARKRGAGEWVKPWAWQGYHGWNVGPISIGEKLDSAIVRISSTAAQEYLAARFPTGHNISRLDVQVTIWGQSDQDAKIALHNQQAVAAREVNEGRPIGIRCVKGNGAGDTLYLGSRASETFVRIYNKEKEQSNDEQWKGAIRYEVEYKDGRARRVFEKLQEYSFSTRVAASVVGDECRYRGVLLPYRSDMVGAIPRTTPLPIPGVDASLLWLERQVSPTIRRLLKEVDRERILMALGLNNEE